jgi:hypothetical protein
MIPHWVRLTPFVGRLSLRYRFRETGASKVGFQQDWLSQKQERICRGTEGSNPFPSSGESGASLTFGCDALCTASAVDAKWGVTDQRVGWPC